MKKLPLQSCTIEQRAYFHILVEVRRTLTLDAHSLVNGGQKAVGFLRGFMAVASRVLSRLRHRFE